MASPLMYLVRRRPDLSGGSPEDYKGWLQAVGPEPTFGGTLNQGCRALNVKCADDPRTMLTPLDIVDVYWTDGDDRFDPMSETMTMAEAWSYQGEYKGTWKYEQASVDNEADDGWTVELTPLAAVLTDVDFSGNYTDVDQVDYPHLGKQHFDKWIQDGIGACRQLSLYGYSNDGNTYAVWFQKYSKTVDTLNRACDIGGLGWWWYCNSHGQVSLSNSARRSWTVGLSTEDSPAGLLYNKASISSHSLYNVQPVTGGMSISGVPLQHESVITSGIWGADAVGRRVAPQWSDPSIMDAATLTQMGDAINAISNAPLSTYNVTVFWPDAADSPSQEFRPGDHITFDYGDETDGPYWVVDVSEQGSTGVFQMTLQSRFGAFHSRPTQAQWNNLANLGALYNGSLGGGGGDCGGEVTIARNDVPGTVTTAADGSALKVAEFVLDSGGECRVKATATGYVEIAGFGTEHIHLQLVDSGGSVIAEETQKIALGSPQAVSMFLPEPNLGMADDAYTARLFFGGSGSASVDVEDGSAVTVLLL